MLAVAYGSLYRMMPSKHLFAPVVGTLFGLVALVQMHSPVEPFAGLIIDMRCVPVALAGAFLGPRGLIPCLLIAAAARYGIGGVGMPAGIAALIAAGGAGLVWQGLTPGWRHGWKSIVVLGLATSVHLIGTVFLPPELAIWFLREAAPILVVLNLIAVPLVATLLEREQLQIDREEQSKKDRAFTGGRGLMGPDAFAWALSQASTSGTLHDGASVIAIRIRFNGALARFWGQDADRVAMETFHARLAAVLPDGGLFGWASDDLVLMAIPRTCPNAARDLLTQIRRDVSAAPITAAGVAPFRLILDLDVKHYGTLPPLRRLVSDVSPSGLQLLGRGHEFPGLTQYDEKPVRFAVRHQPRPSSDQNADLFTTFDQLRDAKYGLP